MSCYVHFWENAAGHEESLAYDDFETALAQQERRGGTIQSHPFSAGEYNRRSDPPSAAALECEARHHKALELAQMAGRHPTGEVVAAIERALEDAAKPRPS